MLLSPAFIRISLPVIVALVSKQIGLNEAKAKEILGWHFTHSSEHCSHHLLFIAFQSVVLAEKGFEAQAVVDSVMQTTQVSLPR